MIPDSFSLVNITDTCAIWHLVGSMTLFKTARQRSVSFVITNTVFYECFVKSRRNKLTPQHQALREHLRAYIDQNQVSRIDLGIDELQDLIVLARQRGIDKRLGQGEISCAAVARHMRQAVLTDNKRDFNAIEALTGSPIQTTPRLLGWLYLEGHLTGSDVDDVLTEHRDSGGQIPHVYKQAHSEACEKRLVRGTSP